MAMILNEEQTMLKDSAKDFCATNAPIGQLRKLRDEENPDGFDRGTWGSMVELGWAAIPWSEDHGGLAFGYKGLGVVTEESGRTLTASPLYASVWVGGTLINLGGSDEQKAELLPQLAAGELLLALALEESHKHDPYGIQTTASATDDGYVLDGNKTFVLDGHVADKLVVAARTSGEAGSREGISLFLVDREANGVNVTRTIMADSRNAANVKLDAVKVGNDALLGTADT
ncbi:MAG: acyl-CoA dehydrogenase family protein, partial [Pseudomonadota bacterium]|nr:acyl-CoA dehydrogenase family protein [Pseudomonadota bacterium]